MNKRILEKIKKLLALAASGNQYEAANAMAKVQALMAANGLTETDIELSSIGPSVRIKVEHNPSGATC